MRGGLVLDGRKTEGNSRARRLLRLGRAKQREPLLHAFRRLAISRSVKPAFDDRSIEGFLAGIRPGHVSPLEDFLGFRDFGWGQAGRMHPGACEEITGRCVRDVQLQWRFGYLDTVRWEAVG